MLKRLAGWSGACWLLWGLKVVGGFLGGLGIWSDVSLFGGLRVWGGLRLGMWSAELKFSALTTLMDKLLWTQDSVCLINRHLPSVVFKSVN